MPKTLVLCDCAGSQSVDADALKMACGLEVSAVHTGLCTHQLEAAGSLLSEGDCLVACQQERATFEALAEELDLPAPDFIDIRDRAGWTAEGQDPGPKMAALVSDALMEVPPTRTFDVPSEGLCLILGAADAALPAAEQLAESLSVTVLLSPGAEPPINRAFDAVTGTLKSASGSLGRFQVRIDAFSALEPGGRGELSFGAPRDGAVSDCDLIVDLRGGPALFPADHKRDGYLRADPGDPLAVQRLLFEASHMVGTFEKPFYVALEEHLCAHSRAGKTGCTNCLDVCPTGAISPNGDHVAVDPNICAGCGACAALCPSGAISYNAPAPGTLFRRMANLASVYRTAGGMAPRLLVHDETHGAEMIRLAARFGQGLPGDVIPLEVTALAGFGHAEMLGALSSGFAKVDVLLAPKTERESLDREVALATALLSRRDVRLLDLTDPEALSDALYGIEAEVLAAPIIPLGGRREVTRLAMRALRPEVSEPIDLPQGAPYGAVLVNTETCTLCLACAGLCPSGALGDNPEKPQLRFQEDACLQCGLCANICPEDAITLQPQMNLNDSAFDQVVLNEEEPATCIECGKAFGTKSTIERIVRQLEGKHPMFAESAQGRMIRMCDDCRVNAQFHSTNNPFEGAPKPRPRTTDDYLN
ncbi:MAG: 4Fe-4S binding protein [Pseudomonadota bacterium]